MKDDKSCPVAAGSTPSKPSSPTFNASTKASITRTGLLSSTQSSRLSGNSVDCARSAPATKRFINSPQNHRENLSSARVFTHPGSIWVTEPTARGDVRTVGRYPETRLYSHSCVHRRLGIELWVGCSQTHAEDSIEAPEHFSCRPL